LAIRGVTLLLSAILIVGLFTGYTRILGHHLLALDIAIFVMAILAGQGVAACLISIDLRQRGLLLVGLVLLSLQVAAYASFTFFPPDHWLFVETRTGVLGLPD
jgi:hypothetical protein